jgi:4'-phosphopantetheinyl transferase EntD
MMPRMQPRKQGRADAADVQEARGARGKSGLDIHETVRVHGKNKILAEQQTEEANPGIGRAIEIRHTITMPSQPHPGPAIAKLFPPGIGSFYSEALPESAALFPEEAAATSGMIDKRVNELRHGRYCARAAMSILGVAPAAIPKGPDRAPIWPKGLTGSISHTGTAAAAAVTRADSFRSIGLDMETSAPLTIDIVDMICLPAENPDKDGDRGKLLFSIKESIYKCLYPITHTYIDFLEMEVRYDMDTKHFIAVSHCTNCPDELTRQLEGRFVIESGYVISAAWLK